MEHAPTSLKKSSHGFSLVELLIALSLVSVVMALAWILLDSTRRVADEIQSPVGSPLVPLWKQLEFEFDRHLPHPQKTKFPSLRFSEETGLEMVSLLPGPENLLLQTELHYWVDEDGLKKSSYTSYPPSAQTNLISADVDAFRVLGRIEEVEFSSYPPETKKELPPRIEIEIESSAGEIFTREFFLPSSFKASSKEFSETETEN